MPTRPLLFVLVATTLAVSAAAQVAPTPAPAMAPTTAPATTAPVDALLSDPASAAVQAIAPIRPSATDRVPLARDAAGAPIAVTTDSPEYCHELIAELEASPDPSDTVRMLTAEGRRLCREGHVIGGLFRLRTAITMLHDNDRQ